MMRIRLAKTVSTSVRCNLFGFSDSFQVAKLDIASMTVQNSATLPPTSSVVFVATLVTWPVIVLTVREAPTGVTMVVTLVLEAVELLVAATLSTVKWSNSCKSCREELQVKMATSLAASKLVPIRVTTTVMRSRGSVGHRPVMWLLGNREAETTAPVMTMDRVTREAHPHGLRVAVEAIMDMARRVATEPLALHPGSNSSSSRPLRPLRVGRLRMVMALMADTLLPFRAWALPGLLLAWELLLLHRACRLCTTAPVAAHHPHPLLLVKDHHLLPRASNLLLPRPLKMIQCRIWPVLLC
ncbi:hypothetical protein BDV32DRAFT_87792 [Aspergillus pseudonomiae]|nr:hypothetical protein BDV32DRAFT_87792 [Aspergillus pseudonomiae]